MMRFLTLLFMAAFSLTKAQTLTNIKIVEENMQKQEVAWNHANIDGFMDYYWKSDSLKFIGSKGITYGWNQTLNNYKKNYPNKEAMGLLTFTNFSIEAFSDSVIHVIGKWELKKNDKNVGGYYTLVWKKINGNWVIVSDHTS